MRHTFAIPNCWKITSRQKETLYAKHLSPYWYGRAVHAWCGCRHAIGDSGPGITDEHLPHIFDRFWQARNATRTGAGLGLAIAKGIVEAHDGTIYAASEMGNGTEIGFDLPIPDFDFWRVTGGVTLRF